MGEMVFNRLLRNSWSDLSASKIRITRIADFGLFWRTYFPQSALNSHIQGSISNARGTFEPKTQPKFGQKCDQGGEKTAKSFLGQYSEPKKQSAKIIFPSWSYKRLKFDLFEAKFPHYDPVNSLS